MVFFLKEKSELKNCQFHSFQKLQRTCSFINDYKECLFEGKKINSNCLRTVDVCMLEIDSLICFRVVVMNPPKNCSNNHLFSYFR